MIFARMADIVEESLGPIVPVPYRMTKKVPQRLGGTCIVRLYCGSGNGKKTILRQASPLLVREYTDDHSPSTNHLSELKRAVRPTLDGPCFCIVRPAQLLTEGVVKAVVKYKDSQTTGVLVGSKKVYGLDSIIYHDSEGIVRDVALKTGARCVNYSSQRCSINVAVWTRPCMCTVTLWRFLTGKIGPLHATTHYGWNRMCLTVQPTWKVLQLPIRTWQTLMQCSFPLVLVVTAWRQKS